MSIFFQDTQSSNTNLKNGKPFNETPKTKSARRPVYVREIIVVILTVILSDAVIYHGAGMAGLAGMIFVLPILLFFGMNNARYSSAVGILGGLAAVTAFKLFWCGFVSTFLCGLFLVAMIGVLLAGYQLRLYNIFIYVSQAFLFSGKSIADYDAAIAKFRHYPSKFTVFSVLIPFVAVCVFGGIFILANPDVVKQIQHWMQEMFDYWQKIKQYYPTPVQVLLWAVSAWIMLGLLRPITFYTPKSLREYFNDFLYGDMYDFLGEKSPAKKREEKNLSEKTLSEITNADSFEHPMFKTCRNLLFAVIALFAVYLVFEFATLWFRKFPDGFYYGGYAHQGAAWLTVALAVSTMILSLVFYGSMYHDRRINFLKILARIWSIENIVLAVAVYHRLEIYIDFNGMTRMRVIGILGVTAVLLGFLFMMVKIAKKKDIDWLFQRYTFSVLSMLFLLCVLPTDMIIHSYNTRRAMNEDYAPVVQMSVHPNSAEGLLTMIPLLNCKDAIIREGVRAILAQELQKIRGKYCYSYQYKWTQFQWSENRLLKQLEQHQETELKEYLDEKQDIVETKKRFDKYVYQWY